MWLVGAIPFFFATWEELFIGAMNFPMINGACDGTLLLGVIGIILGIFGPELVIENYIFNVELRFIIMYFFVVSSIIVGFFK